MIFAYKTIFSCKEAFNQQKLKLEDTTDFFLKIVLLNIHLHILFSPYDLLLHIVKWHIKVLPKSWLFTKPCLAAKKALRILLYSPMPVIIYEIKSVK